MPNKTTASVAEQDRLDRESAEEHKGMTIAGDGAAMLGALMREQHASKLGVYPDGNPNAFENLAAPAAAVPESPSMFANRKDFDAAVGASPEPDSWSGWACQYPGRLPRLYGARHIAEVNLDEENGDRLLFLKEVPND